MITSPGRLLVAGTGSELDQNLAIAYRNLGWGYYRYLDDIPGAIKHYETAIVINRMIPDTIMSWMCCTN